MYTSGLSLQYIFDYSTWVACVTNSTMVAIYIAFLILSFKATKRLESMEGSQELIGHIQNILKKTFRAQSQISTLMSNVDSSLRHSSHITNKMKQ